MSKSFARRGLLVCVAVFAFVLSFASYGAALTPNDPLYNLQWAYPKIEATRAWDLEIGSSSVTIALLDSGLQLDHPDLQGRLWVNPNEIASNGIDDDGNGFVDDINSWDFVSWDNDPSDTNGHGTHVGGIAAATMSNGIGVAGTAQVKLMVLRAFDGGGPGGVWQALEYARNNSAKIVSMSFEFSESGPCSTPIQERLQQLWDGGAVLIAASGNRNSNDLHCPVNHPKVIPVGATTQNDVRWTILGGGSNYGTHLRDNGLVAPGKDIYSTALGSWYEYQSGTSASAPFVSGVAALIRSHRPTLTNAQVKTILLNSADDLGTPGKDIYYGYGRLNAFRAILGSEDRPFVRVTSPADGAIDHPPVVDVTGYVRRSALTPSRAVQQVLVNIENKNCGILPDWRGATITGSDWTIRYDVDGYPACTYSVAAKAFDGVNWSNIWAIQIRIE